MNHSQNTNEDDQDQKMAAFQSCSLKFRCKTYRTGFLFVFLFLIFIGVQVICNVVSVSAVQKSESVIHTHISTHLFFSHLGHYRVLSRVSCATQQILISYLFYVCQCLYVNPISQFIPPSQDWVLQYNTHTHHLFLNDCHRVF